MQHFDSIIIGSGLGGLISAAKLAKEGRKVLLLEQHYLTGGCATAFKRKDFLFEVGLHEMDGLDEFDVKKPILEELGILKNLQLLKAQNLYRFINPDIDIVVPDKVDEAIAVLTQRFPQEKDGIRQFFKTLVTIRQELFRAYRLKSWWRILAVPLFPLLFPHLALISSRLGTSLHPLFWLFHARLWRAQLGNLGLFLDSIFKDETLKLVLVGNLNYYHDDPYSMSLLYYSAANASYFCGGGYFIQGGSQKLSDYLTNYIRQRQGVVLPGQKAVAILTENDRAIAVSYRNAYDEQAPVKTVHAQTIVANMAIPLIPAMLPEKYRATWQKKLATLKKSCSLISVYIGFKSSLAAHNSHYSTFYFEKTRTLRDYAKYSKSPDITHKNPVFVDYSQMQTELTQQGKSVGTICCSDYLDHWQGLSENAYKEKKEKLAQALFDKMERFIPAFRQTIEYYQVATAKTIEHYTLNPGGAVYGYAQTPEQAGLWRLPVKSPLNNLYFASAWSFPGGGFSGAIISGAEAANEILRRHAKINTQPFEGSLAENIIQLIEKTEVAQDTMELRFTRPQHFNYRAGQYVILRQPAASDAVAELPLRAISILSSPSEPHLRFAMRESDSPFKQACINMKPGEQAEIYGPMGQLAIRDLSKPIVFIISGIGITPVIPMLDELVQQQFNLPVWLFYSNRSIESAAYHDKLSKIHLPHYHYQPTYTQQSSRLNVNILTQYLAQPTDYIYYLIGAHDFINDMNQGLISYGIPHEQIIVDDFG